MPPIAAAFKVRLTSDSLRQGGGQSGK